MQLRLIFRVHRKRKSSGIATARAVFISAGVSAETAADGMFAVEGWDDAGFPDVGEPTEAGDIAATVWMDAS
ncbi:hypothetical protein NL532_11555 [Mesorhizobium sp. C120A]|uniref:hypothetical protein n=1 Tax=unclassified Mesorhizobium TaxID=325217 RepID=UPI0003CFBF78|nr:MULTISPECIES: hypothetical protein [unclassified Mesorhizobium]ESZ66609.1 hypothetical protein X728_02625 [Mesorhizobium sp. L103C120A0]WJI47209.1 hypothetical protein NL532_11555 [Mesorhizobium sp. C120A]